MKVKIKTFLSLAVLLLLAVPVLADDARPVKVGYLKLDREPAATGSGDGHRGASSATDAQLDSRKADFLRFAREKIGEMNRNHILSRERMQITKEPDGSYRAVFHQIDDSSLGCEISRSQSKSIPYVAVLTYREQIYAATGLTAEQCRKGPFSPVGFIPNRHIFSYSKGTWN